MKKKKLQYSINEFDNIEINSLPIYSFKSFNDLISKLRTRYNFF